MVKIAECESRLSPLAHNPHNRDGTTDGGLMQINSVHSPRLEALGLDKYDPEDAVYFARILYDESKARTGSGVLPWVCAWKHLAYR